MIYEGCASKVRLENGLYTIYVNTANYAKDGLDGPTHMWMIDEDGNHIDCGTIVYDDNKFVAAIFEHK